MLMQLALESTTALSDKCINASISIGFVNGGHAVAGEQPDAKYFKIGEVRRKQDNILSALYAAVEIFGIFNGDELFKTSLGSPPSNRKSHGSNQHMLEMRARDLLDLPVRPVWKAGRNIALGDFPACGRAPVSQESQYLAQRMTNRQRQQTECPGDQREEKCLHDAGVMIEAGCVQSY